MVKIKKTGEIKMERKDQKVEEGIKNERERGEGRGQEV